MAGLQLQSQPFKIQTFQSRFQMVFGKMVAICPGFNWLGLPISDAIRNPDHLQPNLFLTIQNPYQVGFQIPIVLLIIYFYHCSVCLFSVTFVSVCLSFSYICVSIVCVFLSLSFPSLFSLQTMLVYHFINLSCLWICCISVCVYLTFTLISVY